MILTITYGVDIKTADSEVRYCLLPVKWLKPSTSICSISQMLSSLWIRWLKLRCPGLSWLILYLSVRCRIDSAAWPWLTFPFDSEISATMGSVHDISPDWRLWSKSDWSVCQQTVWSCWKSSGTWWNMLLSRTGSRLTRYTIVKASGHAPPSFVADILTDPESLAKNGKHSENMMQDIKWAAGSLFAGMVIPTLLYALPILTWQYLAGVETVCSYIYL